MTRKHFIRVAGAGAAAVFTAGVTGCARGRMPVAARSTAPAGGAVYVPAGANRTGEEMMIWGAIPLQIKISTEDSGGSFFAFEHADMGRGGPPRHYHYDQDEWFYVVKGRFAFEVDGEHFNLGPGDSLFAPRLVPHAWAHTSDDPGTLLLSVQPAGSLETFFVESSRMTRLPTPDEAAAMFAAHGMRVVGPPLEVD